MSRYIDADALLDTVFEVHCKECESRKGKKNGKYRTIYEVGEAPCRSCGVNDMREYIEDAPTEDVAPVVHGEWLKKGQTLYMCSKCGRVIDAYSDLSKTVENFPYCHCGAKMFVWKTNGEVKDD